MRHYTLLAVIFTAMNLLATNAAQARSPYNPYVSFSIGTIVNQKSDVDVDVNTTITVGGTPISIGSVETEFDHDAGVDLNGAVGFFPHPMIRTELAVGYRGWESEWKVNGINLSAIGFDNIYKINAATLSLNTYLHFTGKDDTYQPYIGLGLGGFFTTIEGEDTGYDEKTNSFLLQVIAGYNHRFNDTLTLGGSYRFNWSEVKPDSDFGELDIEALGHSFLITFMLGF